MYNTSQNYKDKILNDSTQHELNIYIDNNKIEPNHIIDFKSTLELFNNNEFCLGCTPEIDIEFEIDKRDLPESYDEVYIESGLTDELIPVGKFTIQKPIEDDGFKVKIKATDYMKKFEDNNYDGSNLSYPATILQVLQDICTKIGVELGSTSFLNSDKQIAVYDNTVSARTYLSYIAEQAGGFAVIGRDGKLYIKTFGQDTVNVDINLFKDYKWGDKFKVSKVSYEDGVQDYKFGDNTADTIYINQNNMYIVDSEQIENIYNQIKDFEVYSFEGETIIDPAYDIGDILIIEGKKVLYQGELEYAGKFIANIKSKIQAKTEQESMQTKSSSSEKIKRVQSEINQIEGKINQLAQETSEHEEKLTKHEQDIDSIKDTVENTIDITREVSGANLTLENCMEGELLELHIFGNNTVFDSLWVSDETIVSDEAIIRGDSLIKVNDTLIDLGIDKALVVLEDVTDEFVLKNNKATVIRRIGIDNNNQKYVLENEITEELGDLTIKLKKGKNTISIPNYIANMSAKFVIVNDFTKHFASTVELSATMTILMNQINLTASQKVDKEEIIASLNVAIKNGQGVIEAIANSLNIDTDNLKLQDGKVKITSSIDEYYKYSMEDVYLCLQHISNNMILPTELLSLYDVNGDGVVNVADVIKMLNIISGQDTPTKKIQASVDIDPNDPLNTILFSVDSVEDLQSRIGLYQICSYLFKSKLGFFCGDYNEDNNLYGVKITKNGIELTDFDSQVQSSFTQDTLSTYYVIAADGGGKGFCLHGKDESHHYVIHWTGTQLLFYVDGENVSSLSDRRLKSNIRKIDKKLLNVVEEIKLKQFRLKNKEGKVSVGIIAQDLIKIASKYNFNIFDYEIVEKAQYNIENKKMYYMINYEQLLILKNQCLENKIKKIEKNQKNILKRLKELEEK